MEFLRSAFGYSACPAEENVENVEIREDGGLQGGIREKREKSAETSSRRQRRVRIDVAPFSDGRFASVVAMSRVGSTINVFCPRKGDQAPCMEEILATVEEKAERGRVELLEIVLHTDSGDLGRVKGWSMAGLDLDHPAFGRIAELTKKAQRSIFTLVNKRSSRDQRSTLISEFFSAYPPSELKISAIEIEEDPQLPRSLLVEVSRRAKLIRAKNVEADSAFLRAWSDENLKALLHDSPRLTKLIAASWIAGSEPVERRLIVSPMDAEEFREVFEFEKSSFEEFAEDDQFSIAHDLPLNDECYFVKAHPTDPQRRMYLVNTTHIARSKSSSGESCLFFF